MIKLFEIVKVLSLILIFINIIALIYKFLTMFNRSMELQYIVNSKKEKEEREQEIVQKELLDEQRRVKMLDNLKSDVTSSIRLLGFNRYPEDVDQIKKAYRVQAKKAHPDSSTGSTEKFINLKSIYDEAIRDFELFKEKEKDLQGRISNRS